MSKLYSLLNDLTSQIENLERENKIFLKQMDRQTERIKQLKNDLKIKNDIIKNTLTIDRDETDDYINRLKQELFNIYLNQQ